MSSKPRYSDDFKASAVELAQTSEKPVVQIAEELGIKSIHFTLVVCTMNYQ